MSHGVPYRCRDQSSITKPPKPTSPPPPSYDQEAWRRLVESDVDLARVTAVLADYGQQYVDELAAEYLAEIDKERLPAIVDGIVGRASKSVAPHDNGGPADDARPPNPVGSSNERPVGWITTEAFAGVALKLSEKSLISASSPVEPAKRETVTRSGPAASDGPDPHRTGRSKQDDHQRG